MIQNIKIGDVIGIGPKNRWSFVVKNICKEDIAGDLAVTLCGQITICEFNKEVKSVRERILNDVSERLKGAIEKITKSNYEYVSGCNEEPEQIMIKEMNDVINSIKSDYTNLTNEQLREIADLKVIHFTEYCLALWNNIPQLVPGSLINIC